MSNSEQGIALYRKQETKLKTVISEETVLTTLYTKYYPEFFYDPSIIRE